MLIYGKSGSGKSTVGNAIINLIDVPGKVSSGSVMLGDLNIYEDIYEKVMNELRKREAELKKSILQKAKN